MANKGVQTSLLFNSFIRNSQTKLNNFKQK